MTLNDFKEGGEHNDRIIQMGLREIDSSVLAEAMVILSEEERQIILRNMSERASAFLVFRPCSGDM